MNTLTSLKARRDVLNLFIHCSVDVLYKDRDTINFMIGGVAGLNVAIEELENEYSSRRGGKTP